MASWTCAGTSSTGYYAVRLGDNGDIECFTADKKTCTRFTSKSKCQNDLIAAFPVYVFVCPMYATANMENFCSRRLKETSRDDPRLYQCQDDSGMMLASHVNGQTSLSCIIMGSSMCPFKAASPACQALVDQGSSSPLSCQVFDMSKLSAACLGLQTINPSTTVPKSKPPVPTTNALSIVSALPSLFPPNQTATTTLKPSMNDTSIGSNTTTSTTNSESTSGTTIAIAVAGGVVGLLLILLMVYLWRRRQRKKQEEDPSYSNGVNFTSVSEKQYSPFTPSSMRLDFTNINMHRLNASDVVVKKKLGGGGFGEVYYGLYCGAPVAIKKLTSKRQQHQEEVQGFIDEIVLLAKFNSPFIISFVGVAWTAVPDFMCVLEYMDQGDLRDHLKKHSHESYSWSAKLDAIEAIVCGLVYLHEKTIIHRDLKSRNVLMDSKKGVKLSDFGVSRKVSTDTMTVGVGTFRWMAPEVLQSSYYSDKADIYSLGMILSEFDTHRVPFDEVRNSKGQPVADTVIMSMVVNNTVQIHFSDSMPKWLADLAMACTQRDPYLRPSSREVLTILNSHDDEELEL